MSAIFAAQPLKNSRRNGRFHQYDQYDVKLILHYNYGGY
jgi:hypothetical protein